MAAHSLFTTVELVYLTLSFLSVPECARVLLVNKLFFRQGVNLVWSQLSSPAPLFAIFCRHELEVSPSGFRNYKIFAPKKISTERREYLSVYANCVRKVTNFREAFQRQHVRWTGLDGLIRQGPVAAKVQVIEVSWGDSITRSTNVSNIVKLLLGPDTSTLRCHGSGFPGLSVREAEGVLRRAQTVGSRLTELMLQTENPDTEEALVALTATIREFELLAAVDLSKELVTGSMLDCMRDLPNLERLALALPSETAEVSLWDYFVNEGDWVGQPFPSLRSLAFHDSACSAVHRLLSARRPFLHGITQLYVQLESRLGPRSSGSAGLGSFISLVELIVGEASSVQDLTITPPHNPDGPWRFSPEVLSLLFSLDLRRLALHNVRLPIDSPGLALIDGKWPLLSHLVMPFQHVRPNTLLQLAKREALRLLRVEVLAPQLGEEVLTDETAVNGSTAPMRLEGQFDMRETGEHTVETMARLLLYCWPSVSLVWRNRLENWPLEDPSQAAYIALLAKVSELRGGGLQAIFAS
ncbi:hypothetical protein FRC12_004660 [Ceratobasidium sp. 428]|nr:hypothetical protein FRC12_004660 [Ceratobasidium sp. 428]